MMLVISIMSKNDCFGHCFLLFPSSLPVLAIPCELPCEIGRLWAHAKTYGTHALLPYGIHVPLHQIMSKKDFGVMVQNALSPWVQLNVVVAKTRSMFASMRRTFEQLSLEFALPVYTALDQSPIENCVRTQEIVTRTIHLFSNVVCTERFHRL